MARLHEVLQPDDSSCVRVPFEHIPTYLKGYYKYKAGEVYKDENGNIVKDKKDTWDIYAIFYETDEKTKTLDATNRFDHPNLISIARIDEKDRKETDEWTEFYLPFVTKTGKTVDKDKLKAGKYNVAIVFSSSIEGDYFRGAVGSTLHIDEVELILESRSINVDNQAAEKKMVTIISLFRKEE